MVERDELNEEKRRFQIQTASDFEKCVQESVKSTVHGNSLLQKKRIKNYLGFEENDQENKNKCRWFTRLF